MKIVSNVLENIDGIQIYYIIGLLIFVVLFIVIVIRTVKMPKSEAEDIKKSIFKNDTDKSEILINN